MTHATQVDDLSRTFGSLKAVYTFLIDTHT